MPLAGRASHLCLPPPRPGEPAGAKPGLAPGYVVLIAVAVLALVTAAAALLIVRSRRVTGRYKFEARSDDFCYQVFRD